MWRSVKSRPFWTFGATVPPWLLCFLLHWCHRRLCPLSEFLVEAREEQHSQEDKWTWEKWKSVSGDVNHLQLSLQPFCTYRFRVITVNKLGRSEPSEASEHHSTPPAGEWHFVFRTEFLLQLSGLTIDSHACFDSVKVNIKGLTRPIRLPLFELYEVNINSTFSPTVSSNLFTFKTFIVKRVNAAAALWWHLSVTSECSLADGGNHTAAVAERYGRQLGPIMRGKRFLFHEARWEKSQNVKNNEV